MASYTAKVNSIIVYGESSAMPVPVISFSSPEITVDGHSSIVVNPSKIILSSPNIEIVSSHKKVIFSDLGIISFITDTPIQPGIWTVSLKGGASVLSNPEGMCFYGSDITIAGHKTIISTDPAELQFSASDEIFAGSGDIIYPTPSELQFSCSAGLVFGSNIRNLQANLVFSTSDIIILGDVSVPTTMSMTFPGFEMGCFSGGSIEAEIPEIYLEGKLLPGNISSLSASFPNLSMDAKSGGYIDLNIPVIKDFSIQASTNNCASLDAELQIPALYMSASHNGYNRAELILPMLQLSCDVITGETANMGCLLPIPNLIATGFTGEVAEITGPFQMLKLRMEGGRTDPGIISMEMVALKLSMESVPIDEGVLKHIRGKIR